MSGSSRGCHHKRVFLAYVDQYALEEEAVLHPGIPALDDEK